MVEDVLVLDKYFYNVLPECCKSRVEGIDPNKGKTVRKFEQSLACSAGHHPMVSRAPMDFNDLAYFVAIVESGSISAASRTLGVTKSLLSQHLAQLERTLGVRLIERTTRRLDVTPLGQRFYQRCLTVLAEIRRAQAVIEDSRETACGKLKISCPVLFAQAFLMPVVNAFLHEHPRVNLILDADYRDVDLLVEGYDLALRIQRELEENRFIVRSFTLDQLWLVGAPSLLRRSKPPRSLADLDGIESVLLRIDGDHPASTTWKLFDAQANIHHVSHRPRLASSDPLVLKSATVAGLGVALLPSSICARELADRHLLRLLPDYHGGNMQLHASYPSRQGLTGAARCFLDHLAQHLPMQIREIFEHE